MLQWLPDGHSHACQWVGWLGTRLLCVHLLPDHTQSSLQARNIACSVQFKASDDKGSRALSVIYSSAPGTVFCDRANSTVLHHCSTPSFYTEAWLLIPSETLPVNLPLLFFHHLSALLMH